MTQLEREKLLEKISGLVGEHCHGFIFAAEVDCDELDSPAQNDAGMIALWTGGRTLATGLSCRLYHQLQKSDEILWEQEA